MEVNIMDIFGKVVVPVLVGVAVPLILKGLTRLFTNKTLEYHAPGFASFAHSIKIFITA